MAYLIKRLFKSALIGPHFKLNVKEIIMALLKRIIGFCTIFWFTCFLTMVQGHAFSLEQCVDLALKNNPNFKKQQLNMELAKAEIFDIDSQNYGKLDAVSSYTHYNLPRTLAPLTPASIMFDPTSVPTTQDLFVAGLIYEIPLFTGFTQTRSLEIAALQREMTAALLKLDREQLIYNVKTLYVNILSQQAQEDSQTAYIRALQRLHDDITLGLQLGKKAKIDQLKAAADLKNAQTGKARISANITIMKSSLKSLLNIDVLPKLTALDLSLPSLDFVHADFTDQFTGLERLRAAQFAIQKNTKLVEKSEGTLYPRIVMNSAYGQNFGPNDSGNRNHGDWENQEVWQVGLNLRWNLFDFGGSRAKIQKAKIAQQQSRYEKIKTERELRRALEEAVTKINTAIIDYNNARTELAMTREAAAIEQVRFDQGAADINELLYAKARNQLAKSRFTAAAYTCETTRFYLDYLLENGDLK